MAGWVAGSIRVINDHKLEAYASVINIEKPCE